MALLSSKSPFFQLGKLYILFGFILRIVLLLHPITHASVSFATIVKLFFFGLVNDFFVFLVAGALYWLYLVFLSNAKYRNPLGLFLLVGHIGLLLYLIFGNTLLDEYGGSLPEIGIAFVGLKTLLFSIMYFFGNHRETIRNVYFFVTTFIVSVILVQNCLSEYFFWNEFGVRYNFIAVDYLVYTNEVIGNIMESYPVIPLFTGVGLLALLVTWYIFKKSHSFLLELPNLSAKVKGSIVYLILVGFAFFMIPLLQKKSDSNNLFVNEIQSNGLYKFYCAFNDSELDYHEYYPSIPDNAAYASLNQLLKGSTGNSSYRTIPSDSIEIRKNVMLITIESLSAEFMEHYGSPQKLTPFLDQLADESLLFTQLYATGNRTVRGLEAVTLCLPPAPGESVVKRKDNKDKFSIGSVFAQKGYQVNYFYGGDAYFDNMKDFFGGNGYSITDKTKLKPNEITFSNIWGVCDEDMANKILATMSAQTASGKPVFSHWMTVSNHRPFTYPDHKIDISPTSKSREGGVKYTDYALKRFFEKAKTQPWFKNTVFVIVADHCASSSGKTSLPLDRYRIPAMVYAPGFIQPQKCTKLISQIDLMPTVMGLLNMSYASKFYGQNVLSNDYKPRAFIATYQDLGYISNGVLTILSPKKQVKQYRLELGDNPNISEEFKLFYYEIPLKKSDNKTKNEAITYYQTTTDLLKKKKLQRLK